MNLIKTTLAALALFTLSACVAGGSPDVLTSVQDEPIGSTASANLVETPIGPSQLSEPLSSPASTEPEQLPQPVTIASAPADSLAPNSLAPVQNRNAADNFANGEAVFASEGPVFGPFLKPRNKKTYLINGLASNIKTIGYGFTNLSRKIPGSVLHNYAGPLESSTVIRSRVTRQLKAEYKRDRNVEINLIGISFGANIVTLIAQELDRVGIPVNYLATLDGPAMVPIRENVRVADNFTCTNLDCFRTTSRLARSNKKTRFDSFRIKSSHIPLADHPTVHRRVIRQINAPRRSFVSVR